MPTPAWTVRYAAETASVTAWNVHLLVLHPLLQLLEGSLLGNAGPCTRHWSTGPLLTLYLLAFNISFFEASCPCQNLGSATHLQHSPGPTEHQFFAFQKLHAVGKHLPSSLFIGVQCPGAASCPGVDPNPTLWTQWHADVPPSPAQSWEMMGHF